MAESGRVVSEREFREWIPSCPVQIKKMRIEEASPGGERTLTVFSVPCGDFSVRSFAAQIEYRDERRELLGTSEIADIGTGESAPLAVTYEKAAYASALIRSVTFSSGEVWENRDLSPAVLPPNQKILWQTDPLYETIRAECEGTVPARFEPDEIDGAWRCACGQINLESASACGSCGTSRAWLKTHFDRTYLESRKAELGAKKANAPVHVKKVRKTDNGDKLKAALILGAAAAVIVLAVLTVKVFIPGARYSSAVKLAEAGDYDGAVSIFSSLGSFRDSADRMRAAVYDKAREMTGLDEVNMTTSAASPWFSIDENGVLSLRKDKYEEKKGTIEEFVVPDMVDGVIVRELDRNFFLNCKELKTATLSDCLEVLGEQSFYNCEALETVNFGKNLKTIGPRCFINCYALEDLEIPDTVESLGVRAFNNCVKLRRVVLGKGITAVGDYTFALCVELKSVTLTSPLTAVGVGAFAECSSFEKIFCRFPESDWIGFDLPADEENSPFLEAERLFDQ